MTFMDLVQSCWISMKNRVLPISCVVIFSFDFAGSREFHFALGCTLLNVYDACVFA
jgi:hypothetical protein